MTTIKLVGVEDIEQRKQERPSMRFYGYRVTDMANRLVVIEVSMKEGASIMNDAAREADFPEVEVEDNQWAYVGGIGKDEARFRKEDGLDNTPPR
jgi:hypothetical protein